jgi:hypothetical protein
MSFCHHLVSVVCHPFTFHILIFSENPQPNELKLGRKHLWKVLSKECTFIYDPLPNTGNSCFWFLKIFSSETAWPNEPKLGRINVTCNGCFHMHYNCSTWPTRQDSYSMTSLIHVLQVRRTTCQSNTSDKLPQSIPNSTWTHLSTMSTYIFVLPALLSLTIWNQLQRCERAFILIFWCNI